MINLLKNLLLVVIVVIFNMDVVAGNQCEIKIKIDGNIEDSAVLLASYYGEKIKIIDTAYAIKQGEFVFLGKEKLPGGIYMIVNMDKKKLFEFIVSSDQKFTLRTDESNYALNMKISGSDENTLFYSYLAYNEKQYKTNKLLLGKIDSIKSINGDLSYSRSVLDTLNKQTSDYKISIINDNQGTFVSALLNSMRDVEVPDSIKNSSDSTLPFIYYKQHFWDYINLSDSTLLRSPVFMRKVNQYFDQTVVSHPDSVIAAIDVVISEARPSQEVVGYLVWYFISEYQNPEFMGFDKVFVHLVDEYFSNEYIPNTTPSILTTLQDRADKIRPILLYKPAPNLMLIDTSGVLRTFNTIPDDYTVLFFWDSDCGICTKEIIELKNLYNQHDSSIEIFAINVNSDLEKWKIAMYEKDVPGINVNGTRSSTKDFHDLYDIYGTPVIYLLDKDKKIIAKRIGASRISEFIDNYEKQNVISEQ
jgi:thiol-disulfide isomerase/thioredoxin